MNLSKNNINNANMDNILITRTHRLGHIKVFFVFKRAFVCICQLYLTNNSFYLKISLLDL